MRRRVTVAIVVAWFGAGCVRSDSVQCADGSLCPRDLHCAAVADTYVCVSDEQLVSCVGKVDFSPCEGGACFEEVCLPPSCGDGRVGPVEVCDDGNTSANDGCSADCRSDETCGNGVIDLALGEECDDGAAGRGLSHDGCSSTCRTEQPGGARSRTSTSCSGRPTAGR